MRDPQRLFVLAPLVEELLPLLLVGRDGSLPGATEPDRDQWAHLLQVGRDAGGAWRDVTLAAFPERFICEPTISHVNRYPPTPLPGPCSAP